MRDLEIFRPGRHVSMGGESIAYSEADLAACATGYDPALHEAPIVVGHPKSDDPAYGWVQSLAFAEGRLSAAPHQVDPTFAEMVAAGRFKKVSAAFYRPDAAANPKPGVWYLRHVGFLGATVPALKGLKPVQFAADEDGVVEFAAHESTIAGLFRSLREWVIGKHGIEDADAALPGWRVDVLQEDAALPAPDSTASAFAEPRPDPAPDLSADHEESDMDDATKTELEARDKAAGEREAELEKQAGELEEKAAAFAESQVAARRADNESFLGALVEQGRFLPANTAATLDFMDGLEATEAVAFGEGGETTALAVFRGLLESYPKQIAFGEVSGGDDAVDTSDPEALAREGVAYQEEQAARGITITTRAAVRHVAGAGGATS